MPELPEIRVHAERLAESHRSHVLKGVQALSFTALKTFDPPPESAVGQPLGSVTTRGKHLLLNFDTVTFVVHLMQGGRIVADPKQSKKPRNGLFRWLFTDADAWLLTEAGHERKAGVWVMRSGTDPELFADLGPDADALDQGMLNAILDTAGGSRLHGVLRDQHRVAGLGRRLANEICWTAQLSPFSPCKGIAADDRLRLLESITRCIEESIEDERSRDFMARSAERVAHVHHRTGEPCARCGDAIREVSYNAYSVNYCATCQTGGKVLADNTTSKFLK